MHGFAAGGEFFFGRRLEDLRPQEMALLIGLVKGPSYYDPRRYPDRALARRNLVLQQFHDTGLLDDAQTKAAQATPLGIAANAQLPHNRFPAFMQLVRSQITADFDEAALRDGSLSIFTTLDPSAQLYTEQAILGDGESARQAWCRRAGGGGGHRYRQRQRAGRGRFARSWRPGFNRALDARRPIGSLVKPLVYLVALAQPAEMVAGLDRR